MAIDVTTEPGKTMKRLADALSSRQARFTTLTSYLDGNAPLPEAAKKLKKSYREFQQQARVGFAPGIVRAPQERMIPVGWRVDDSADYAKEAAYWWSVNEMGRYASQVHGDMLGLVWGYAIVGDPDEAGVPVITREDPRQCITEHDALRPSKVTAALKMYRDEVSGKDYAYLYLPGYCYIASRPSKDTSVSNDIASYDWDVDEWVNDGRLSVDAVPVVCFTNDGPVPGVPMAEFEPYLDDINRINWMLLQRLIITAMQAYRQRALIDEGTGGDDAFPDTEKGVDAEGNEIDVPIDYEKRFMPGVGRFFMLPRGVKIWESQYTDITPILSAVKDDIRTLAAETSTPLPLLMPDAQNQSAEGASSYKEGLYSKVRERCRSAGYGWNRVMQLAFAFAGRGWVNVETEWAPAELVSLSEKADAWSKMADLPLETKLRVIMQLPPDAIDRVMSERMGEALSGFAANTPTDNGV